MSVSGVRSEFIANLLYGASAIFLLIAGWLFSRRGLTIHLAEWGPGPKNGDYETVTETVRGHIKNHKTIEMRASDENLGDRFPGKSKHLRVRYSLGGERNALKTVNHNDWLRLPE